MSDILQLEQFYKAPINAVWEAISDREKLSRWFVEIADFKAEVGCVFHFSGTGTEGHEYHHTCVVREVVPGKLLSYSWKYEGYVGESEVRFELFEEGEGTWLRLSHAGLETFPSDAVNDFRVENFREGWGTFLGTALKGLLEGK